MNPAEILLKIANNRMTRLQAAYRLETHTHLALLGGRIEQDTRPVPGGSVHWKFTALVCNYYNTISWLDVLHLIRANYPRKL